VEANPIPVAQIMKNHKVSKKKWFKKKDYLKKEEFLSDLKVSLSESLADLVDDYKGAYETKHKEIVERLNNEFRGRVEEYSTDTKAKIEDKNAMMQLGEKLKEVSDSVKTRIEELEKKIWQRSVNNG
jgi:gas vesicle protein